PELNSSMALLEKRQITFSEFMGGYELKGEKHKGYDELRMADNIFSRFQFFEHPSVKYDAINNCVYNFCKALEPFISKNRSEAEFAHISEKFEQINIRTTSKKSDKNINCMLDVFKICNDFKQILKKVAQKFSFIDEYRKAEALYQEFLELQKTVIVYNMEEFEREEKEIEALLDEEESKKFARIVKEMKEHIDKKTLPFDKIDEIFNQLRTKDFHVFVVEKEADDLSIKITPPLIDKYGEANLRRINILISEIDFWFFGTEKLEKFEKLSAYTDKIQACEELEMKSLVQTIKILDKEIEFKFRKNYGEITKSLSGVIAGVEKYLSDVKEVERIEERLMEKGACKGYKERLVNAKKNVLILGSDNAAFKAGNINKFPFIYAGIIETDALIYELAMRLYVAYDADRRSTTNIMNILSLYSEYNDFQSLWLSLATIIKTKMVPNFGTFEDKIKRVSRNKNVLIKLAQMFKSASNNPFG
ncbi:MAG: hypothetical protein HQK84_10125, partial [Nitrospinae bacterium]|nr:hypothetical protein [Nitrospinota bacterium]